MSGLRIIFVALAILTMAFPPLFDTFDTWDKGVELPVVGHNTETTIVVASVGVGICIAVAFISTLVLKWITSLFKDYAASSVSVAQTQFVRATDYLLLLFSPPWRLTSLRI